MFFHCSNATTWGPYTAQLHPGSCAKVEFVACAWPHMPSIMWASFTASANDPTGRERLLKLADMWVGKNVVNARMRETLIAAMKSSMPPPTPHLIPLVRPTIMLGSTHMHYPLPPPPPMYPPPPPPPPPMYPPPLLSDSRPTATYSIDLLQNMTVGTMANLVRRSCKINPGKYRPLDVGNLALLTQSGNVEAGRLEMRINEFYRKQAELLKNEK